MCVFAAFSERNFGGVVCNSFEHREIRIVITGGVRRYYKFA